MSAPKPTTLLRLLLVLLLAGLGACVTPRNFADPRQRITEGTAYSLTKGEVRVDAGLVGTEVADAGANVDVAAGFGRSGQVSTNVAHLSLGLVNASLKYTILDRPWFGLGVEGGFLWTRPTLIWLLPDELSEPLAGIDLFHIPLRVLASFPVASWASLHLGVGYTHAEIVGALGDESSSFLNAGIGARSVQLDPTVHFYLNRRVALILGANLPLYITAAAQVESDVELDDGIVLGIRSAEWIRIPTEGASLWRAGVEVRFGRATHMQLFVSRGLLAAAGLGPPLLPSINFYWRI